MSFFLIKLHLPLVSCINLHQFLNGSLWKKLTQKLTFSSEQKQSTSSIFENFEKMLDFERLYYLNHLIYSKDSVERFCRKIMSISFFGTLSDLLLRHKQLKIKSWTSVIRLLKAHLCPCSNEGVFGYILIIFYCDAQQRENEPQWYSFIDMVQH